MKNDDILFLKDYVRTVQEPENLFSGKRLPAGFALAWAYRRSGSIFASILIHMSVNQIGMLLMR